MLFLGCGDQLYAVLKIWRQDFLQWQNVIFGDVLSTLSDMGNLGCS